MSLGTIEKLTEAKFIRMVLDLAKLRGWRSAHFRPSRTKSGWRTAVQGDGKGWPDLILLRDRRMIVAELKVGNGKLTAEQQAWLAAFSGICGANIAVQVWTPAMWERIEAMLA